jgi:hypothetical protein
VFAEKLMAIADSSNLAERTEIVAFYSEMVTVMPETRPFLIGLCQRCLQPCLGDTADTPFLIATVLALVLSLLSETWKTAEGARFFRANILPLFSHPFLNLFNGPMSKLVDAYMEGEGGNAFDIFRYLLLKWPRTVSSKQFFFLNYLVRVLARVSALTVQQLLPKLKEVFRELLQSPSPRVMDVLLDNCRSPIGERMLLMHGPALVPMILDQIEEARLHHWSSQVRSTSCVLMTLLLRRQGRFLPEDKDYEQSSGTPPQVANWMSVAMLAQRADASIQIVGIMGEVSTLYGPRVGKMPLQSSVDLRHGVSWMNQKAKQRIVRPVCSCTDIETIWSNMKPDRF